MSVTVSMRPPDEPESELAESSHHPLSEAEQAQLDADFVIHSRDVTHRALPLVLGLGIALVPAFFLLDYIMSIGPWVDEPGLLARYGAYRGAAAVVLAIQLAIIRRTQPTRWSLAHAHFGVAIMALALIALIVDTDGFDNPYFAGLLIIIGGVGLIPWSGLHAGAAGGGIILVYALGCALRGGDYQTANMVLALSLFSGMLIISVALSHLRHTSIREEFSNRWKLARAERRAVELQQELREQHEALQRQHDALRLQQQTLLARDRQVERLFSAATAALPGSKLDEKYILHEELASGGFGTVFRATQLTLDRPVAVKVFKPPSAEQADRFLARFRREGVTACRVAHPNAVEVYDSGISEGGLPFLVMELLEGETVDGRLEREGPMSLPRVLEILADVCAVLAAAHEAGIIHRDIKPSNIFLQQRRHEPDLVKVLDFGIAKLMDEPSKVTVTQDEQLLGTPRYMAPERLKGGEQTGRSDVYSVAVTMYEMLTGRTPFDTSEDVWATMWNQVTEEPEPLDAIDASLPPEVVSLALRCLSKLPTARPNASALEFELRRLSKELAAED